MTQVDIVGRKVTCGTCDEVYRAHPYFSYYSPHLSKEQQKRTDEGRLNFFPCPKCGEENEARSDLPDWQTFEKFLEEHRQRERSEQQRSEK